MYRSKDWYGLPEALTWKLRAVGVDRFDDLFNVTPQAIFDIPQIGHKTLAKVLRAVADRTEAV